MFKIKSATHLLVYFNYMFLGILIIFIIGLILKWAAYYSAKNERKVANNYQN